jgi:hypothetical protein
MTDREKTIEALARIHTFVHDWGLTVLGEHDAKLVYDAIARGEVPGVGVDGGWRCASDEPPTDDREALVFCAKTKAMFVGRMGASSRFEYFDKAEDEWLPADLATHWRELPKGPLL